MNFGDGGTEIKVFREKPSTRSRTNDNLWQIGTFDLIDTQVLILFIAGWVVPTHTLYCESLACIECIIYLAMYHDAGIKSMSILQSSSPSLRLDGVRK